MGGRGSGKCGNVKMWKCGNAEMKKENDNCGNEGLVLLLPSTVIRHPSSLPAGRRHPCLQAGRRHPRRFRN